MANIWIEEEAKKVEDHLYQRKGLRIPIQDILNRILIGFLEWNEEKILGNFKELEILLKGNSFPEDGVGIREVLYPLGKIIGKIMLMKKEESKGQKILSNILNNSRPEMRCVGCVALGEIGKKDLEAVIPYIYKLAMDEDWRVRDFIARVLDEEIGKAYPEQLFNMMKAWAKDRNEKIRRVPTQALLSYGWKDPEPILELMKQLLHDESLYVRKGVCYCLQTIGKDQNLLFSDVRRENPGIVFKALKEWIKEDHRYTLWIITKTLSEPTWTKLFWWEVLEVLKSIVERGREELHEAVFETIMSIFKYNAHKVFRTLKEWTISPNKNVQKVGDKAIHEINVRSIRCHEIAAL